MTDSKIQSGKTLLENGVPPHKMAQNMGVSVPTLYSLDFPYFDKQMKSLVNASPSKICNLRATPVNVPLARPCGG